MTSIAILGYGGRGQIYGQIILKNAESMSCNAVCEISDKKLSLAKTAFQVNDEQVFSSDEEFLQKKRADICIIATQDQDHYRHTIAALKLGYDILLEKPISPSEKECDQIQALAEKMGRKVAVCHVLRYTPFYSKIKQIIESGQIGKVLTVSQTENVGYWHMAHSFVRGHWRNHEQSSPMILAKCCHDVDILQWLIAKDCKKVSSFGSLDFFKKQNQPPKAKDFCYLCNVLCPYNAVDFYLRQRDWLDLTGIYFGDKSDKSIREFLSEPKNPYARCVFACDNDVVDHQVVNMLFEEGVTAQLTMTAFSRDCHRNLKVHATLGEIEADMEQKTIVKRVFGGSGNGSEEIIDVNKLSNDFSFHGGGDKKMLEDFVRFVSGDSRSMGLTDIKNSVLSHKIAFAAERSRVKDGCVQEI